MRPRSVAGIVLVLLAITTALFLGTFGWLAVGFGMLTDCTNAYSCSETGCPPCAPAQRWINTGGVAQLLLAVVGVVVLVVGLRSDRRGQLPWWGAGLLLLSVAVVVGTTWRAQESYCQPGTPGYEQSSCWVDG